MSLHGPLRSAQSSPPLSFQLFRRRWPGAAAFLTAAGLLAASIPAAAQTVSIDPFSTNQSALLLTFPPAGTTLSSSVAGADILGGERDMMINLTGGVIAGNNLSSVVSSGFLSYSQDATITGSVEVQWDGADNSAALNPTGLGGLDLTAGGMQNAFDLRVAFDDLPVDVTFEVFTDAGNASSFTFVAPGLIFAATDFVLPYTAFTPSLGAGADFSNVGAIRLTMGSGVTAPDVVLDFLQTTSSLTASKTVAIVNDVDGDGNADPGDRLRYTILLANPDDAGNASSTGVTFTNPVPANTALVIGSVTTSQGTVTAGNTAGDSSIGVDVGTIADAASATITFDVTIDNPLPAGVTQITCQGTVGDDSLTGLLTDDPTVPGNPDPTVIPVTAAPAVSATKAAIVVVDSNGNGQLDPGETLQYNVVITNNGNQDAAGAVFTSGVDPNTNLVVGSVTTTAGAVTIGTNPGDSTVSVAVGTIPGNGGTVTITFRVTVDNPLAPGVTQIACQGTVTGNNFPTILTDDSLTPTSPDPTVTPVNNPAPPPPVAEVPTLQGWGVILLTALLAAAALLRMRRGASPGRAA